MKIVFFVPRIGRQNCEDRPDYRSVRESLVAMGHELVDFEYSREIEDEGKDAVLGKVREMLSRERPDVFFHGMEGDEMDASFAKFIRSETGATSLLFLDDRAESNDSIKWVPHYDFSLVTSRKVYEHCEDKGYENALFFPWGYDADLHFPLEVMEKKYDLAFVGRADKERYGVIAFLREKGIDVRVWGEGWEDFPDLRDISRGLLPIHKVREVLALSRIVLGMEWSSTCSPTPQVRRAVFERAACRVFQITNLNPRLEQFFEIGREVVCYETLQELPELINYYLAHSEERGRIADAAYRRTLGDHTWERRFSDAFARINDRLPDNKSRWDVEAGHHRETLEPEGRDTHPRVSLLCYTYNFAEYLDSLIPSVISQTFKDFELLILDDGSTDNTREIVNKYTGDRRVRYVYQENMGKGGRHFDKLIQRCLALTTGELVSVVGGDDMLEENNLEMRVRCFDEDPEVDIVFHDATLIDARGNVVPGGFKHVPDSLVFESRDLLRLLFNHNMVGHPTALLKRTSVENMGGFEMRFGCDTHFWLKSAPHLKFKFLNKKLIRYRVHEKGASTGSSSQALTLAGHNAAEAEARTRYSILDIFPEIELCSEKKRALYSAYLLAGNTLARAGTPQPFLALKEYERALQHDPSGFEALNNMAIMHCALNNVVRAQEIFQHLGRTCVESAVLYNSNLLVRALAGDTRNLDFRLLSEGSLNSELVEVIERLDREKITRERSTAYVEVGRLAEEGRYDEVASILEELLEVRPADSEVYSDLCFAYFKRQDKQKALACVRRALELDPANVEALSNFSVLLFDAGQTNEAFGVCEEVLRLKPGDINMLLFVARLRAQSGLTENALCLYERVLALQPDNRDAVEGVKQLRDNALLSQAAV